MVLWCLVLVSPSTPSMPKKAPPPLLPFSRVLLSPSTPIHLNRPTNCPPPNASSPQKCCSAPQATNCLPPHMLPPALLLSPSSHRDERAWQRGQTLGPRSFGHTGDAKEGHEGVCRGRGRGVEGHAGVHSSRGRGRGTQVCRGAEAGGGGPHRCAQEQWGGKRSPSTCPSLASSTCACLVSPS